MLRAEHNCHLCKNEFLGRCFGSINYGKDVSINDTPICEQYKFSGCKDHIKAIEVAESLGVTELSDEIIRSLLYKKYIFIDKEYIEAFEKGKHQTAKYYKVSMYNLGSTIKLYKPSIMELFRKRTGHRYELIEGVRE